MLVGLFIITVGLQFVTSTGTEPSIDQDLKARLESDYVERNGRKSSLDQTQPVPYYVPIQNYQSPAPPANYYGQYPAQYYQPVISNQEQARIDYYSQFLPQNYRQPAVNQQRGYYAAYPYAYYNEDQSSSGMPQPSQQLQVLEHNEQISNLNDETQPASISPGWSEAQVASISSRTLGSTASVFESQAYYVSGLMQSKDFSINEVDPSDGNSALCRVVETGKDSTAVRLLIQWGSNINVRCKDGETPLIIAARTANKMMINLLLNDGRIQVDLKNLQGYTALHSAVVHNHIEIVQTLAIRGSDINIVNEKKIAPVLTAESKGFDDIVALLMEHKLYLNAVDENSRTLLHNLVLKPRRDNVLINLALKNGIDIDAQDCNGDTALILGTLNNDREIVKLLLQNNAKTLIKNMYNETAFRLAKGHNHNTIKRSILKEKFLRPFNVVRNPELRIKK